MDRELLEIGDAVIVKTSLGEIKGKIKSLGQKIEICDLDFLWQDDSTLFVEYNKVTKPTPKFENGDLVRCDTCCGAQRVGFIVSGSNDSNYKIVTQDGKSHIVVARTCTLICKADKLDSLEKRNDETEA